MPSLRLVILAVVIAMSVSIVALDRSAMPVHAATIEVRIRGKIS